MTNLEQYAHSVQTDAWWGYFFCRGCEACPAQSYCHAQPSGTCCRENFMQWAGEETAGPPNDPLTLTELRGMDGEPIYIQYIGTCEGFYDNETAPYYGQFEQYVQKYNGMLRACDLPLKYYGKTWLAYRRKPDGGGEQ